MPVYRYEAAEPEKSCQTCRNGFDAVQSIRECRLEKCPDCGNGIRKVPVAASVGHSQASFDDRAKAAGFSKLKRLGKGEYEKQY